MPCRPTEKVEGFEKQKQSNFQKLWKRKNTVPSARWKISFGKKLLVIWVDSRGIATASPLYNLHLANSMSVRYANLVDWTIQKNIQRIRK